MTAAVGILSAVVLLLTFVVWARWPAAGEGSDPGGRLLAERMRHKVVVTLKSGQAFEGVLYDLDERTVVLRNARPMEGAGPGPLVDGEVLLERSDVDYLQRL